MNDVLSEIMEAKLLWDVTSGVGGENVKWELCTQQHRPSQMREKWESLKHTKIENLPPADLSCKNTKAMFQAAIAAHDPWTWIHGKNKQHRWMELQRWT